MLVALSTALEGWPGLGSPGLSVALCSQPSFSLSYLPVPALGLGPFAAHVKGGIEPLPTAGEAAPGVLLSAASWKPCNN